MNREKRGQLAERARVLRVKLGYNPNSSSVGSEIPKFLAFALASGVAVTLWLHLRGRVGRLIREWRSRDAGDHGSEVE